MKCSYCGTDLESGSKFCKNCGAAVDPATSKTTNMINTESSVTPTETVNNLPQIQPLNTQTTNTKPKGNLALRFIIILLIVAAIVLYISFTKKDTKESNFDGDASRTIMIYMVGSDLESGGGMATANLDSIDYDEIDNENVKVVLIAGGSKKWYNDYISNKDINIYELTKDGFEVKETLDVNNMGKSNTLETFLKYSYKNYKTELYDLVFWNHGLGILGAEHDELKNDALSLDEISSALKNSKMPKLEMIVFSTCLNGSIEVAAAVKDYANYLVASEELMMGSGYTSEMNYINDIKSTDDSIDVAKKFVAAYKDEVNQIRKYSKTDIYGTFSIIDLNKIDDVIKNMNDFFSEVDVDTDYRKIAISRSNLYQYGANGGTKDYDAVDLYNFVNDLKSINKNKAEKLLDSIEDAVVYNYASDPRSRGISVYFPYNGSKDAVKLLLSVYKSFDEFSSYNKVITSFADKKSKGTRNMSFSSRAPKIDRDESAKDSDFEFTLSDEEVSNYAKAKIFIFKDTKDGYFKPTYIGREVTLDGNTLKASIKDRQLVVYSEDNPEQTENVMLIESDRSTEDILVYEASIGLEHIPTEDESFSAFEVKAGNMTIELNRKTNEITPGLITINPGKTADGQVLPTREAADLNKYNHIYFASSHYQIMDSNGKFNEIWTETSNGTIEGLEFPSNDFKFKLTDLNDGYDYYAIFAIYDINNNVYYTDGVKME